MAIPHTYELYLLDGEGGRRFEALTCRPVDVSRRAQEVLSRDRSDTVEVWEAGKYLYTFGGAPGSMAPSTPGEGSSA